MSCDPGEQAWLEMRECLHCPILQNSDCQRLANRRAQGSPSGGKRGFYPSCAENPAVQGGDVERGERSWPKLNSVSAAARCTGG